MTTMTATPMTDTELALYRAQRALSLWQSRDETRRLKTRVDVAGNRYKHDTKVFPCRIVHDCVSVPWLSDQSQRAFDGYVFARRVHRSDTRAA